VSRPDRQTTPLVSVVVPTADRSQLVARAVRSALAQTLREIEVVVVVDGPDPATTSVLARIDDPRLCVLELPQRRGVGEARNAGVERARAEWIALLDDDDEWQPEKLALQLATARASALARPIVSCRFAARDEHGEVVLPRRTPSRDEPLAEYLFCQRGLLGGEGLVLPSTILAPATLLREVPFRHRRLPHEGSDWLLRALKRPGTGLELAATRAPLAVFHGEETRERMSNATDWRASLAWAADNRDLLTPRAYAGFVLTRASLEARRGRDWRASLRLVGEAFRGGRPTIACLIACALIWLVPRRTRASIGERVARLRARPAAAP
jgi:glycosyltransferase involved in cell wall biosynthesis